MESIGDRIAILLHSMHISASTLAKEIGVTKGAISRWTKNEANPGSVQVARIIAKHKEINLNWLMLGEGEMLIKNDEKGAMVENSTLLEKSEILNRNFRRVNDSERDRGTNIFKDGNIEEITKYFEDRLFDLSQQNEKLISILERDSQIISILSNNQKGRD
jgi:transcriptional regulator with XRE-family HTH domain